MPRACASSVDPLGIIEERALVVDLGLLEGQTVKVWQERICRLELYVYGREGSEKLYSLLRFPTTIPTRRVPRIRPILFLSIFFLYSSISAMK
jgi:hypothetical protein